MEWLGRHPALLEALGICRDQLGDAPGAERLYREALPEGTPGVSLCYHLALCLWHQGRGAEARQWLEEALRQEPDHARALDLLRQLSP